MKILFASSEAHPLIKTGGLADVAGSLPRAVLNQRQDIRLVIPAYRGVLQQADNLQLAAHLELAGVNDPVRILAGRLPGSNVNSRCDRAGNHYPGHAQRLGADVGQVVSVAIHHSQTGRLFPLPRDRLGRAADRLSPRAATVRRQVPDCTGAA